MELDYSQMLKISQADDAFSQFCALAKELRKTEPSARAVYEIFLMFTETIADDEDDAWEPLYDAMDCMCGRWCAKETRLFPDEIV